MVSYRIFEALQSMFPAQGDGEDDIGHGIRMRVANFFFDQAIESNPEEYQKMQEIEAAEVRVCPASGFLVQGS